MISQMLFPLVMLLSAKSILADELLYLSSGGVSGSKEN